MSIDGLFLTAMKNELEPIITGSRVRKIHQLSNYELVFQLSTKQGTKNLFISTHPNYARLNVTTSNLEKPMTPPLFCMVLRKHFEGAVLTDVKQFETDRILIFDFAKMNEFYDKTSKKMIVEIMGRHSNITIVDDSGKIIDCIKRLPPSQNSYRILMPGATYKYPPITDKVNPLDVTVEKFNELITMDNTLDKQLMKNFIGIGPVSSKIISNRIKQGLVDNTFNRFKETLEEITKKCEPVIVEVNEKTMFYSTSLSHLENEIQEVKRFDTVSELLDNYFFGKDHLDRTKQIHKDVIRFVKGELDKNIKKLEALNNDLKNAEDHDEYKRYGDLILSNLYDATVKDGCLLATDWYDENTKIVKVPINPLKTLNRNAENYFTKYQKAITALDKVAWQIDLTKKEISYFTNLYEQLKYASVADATEIRQELEANRYLRQSKFLKAKKKKKPNYTTYSLDNGIDIIVGKNNLQNNYVTHKLADRFDWWFHAKDAAGSHVIVRSTLDELDEYTIRTAAQLASYFSKWQDSSSVPVDYTRVKNLKKVPGHQGSFVTYNTNKTIYIDPDEQFIKSLKVKKLN